MQYKFSSQAYSWCNNIQSILVHQCHCSSISIGRYNSIYQSFVEKEVKDPARNRANVYFTAGDVHPRV